MNKKTWVFRYHMITGGPRVPLSRLRTKWNYCPMKPPRVGALPTRVSRVPWSHTWQAGTALHSICGREARPCQPRHDFRNPLQSRSLKCGIQNFRHRALAMGKSESGYMPRNEMTSFSSVSIKQISTMTWGLFKAINMQIHLLLTGTLQRLHFTGRETEALRCEVIVPKGHIAKEQCARVTPRFRAPAEWHWHQMTKTVPEGDCFSRVS